MAELTSTGYKVKTLTDWMAEITQAYKDIDSQWGLDPSTPDGLFIATISQMLASLDELSQTSYNSKDPAKATGLDLDILTYLTTGSPRKIGTSSSVTMALAGQDGTLVIKGSGFKSTVDGTQWNTNADVTIVSGVASVTASCETLGAITANIGDITVIASPIAGLTTTTNSTVATVGTDRESDAELRERRQKSVATTGSNQVDNIFAAVSSGVPGVGEVKIYENWTGSTDSNSIDPHSMGIIVNGGLDDDIAQAIYNKKNPGCGLTLLGSDPAYKVTVNVESSVTGNILPISFNRPTPISIHVDLTVQSDGHLPSNISTLLSDSIIAYAAGQTEYTQGFRLSGFRIGDDVIYSSLYTPVNQILGEYGESYVTELKINRVTATATTPDVANIVISAYELAQFTAGEMTISITAAP